MMKFQAKAPDGSHLSNLITPELKQLLEDGSAAYRKKMMDPLDDNIMGQSKNVQKVEKPGKETPMLRHKPGPVPNYLGEYG